MKRKKIRLLFFFLIAFVPLQIFAQQDSASLRANDSLPAIWNLQQCLDFAFKNNIRINTLQLTAKSNEQNYLQSKAAKLPNLSGSVTQYLTNNRGFDSLGIGAASTFRENFTSNYSLNSSLILYNGGYLNNDIKQKNVMIQSSLYDIEAAKNDITLQITEAYLNILLAKENIIFLEDLVNTSKSQYDLGQLQYNAGSIAKKDFVNLEAQWANDKYNLVTAQNSEKLNTLALKQILQLPPDYKLQVVKPDTIVALSTAAPLSDVEQVALNNRPEIKSSEMLVQSAELDLEKAKAGTKPTLSSSGAVATGYSGNLKDNYLKQIDNNFYQRIGLSLSIPIFNNRIAKTNIEKSKIEIDQAGLNLKNTQMVLSQQIEQAYIQALNAKAQYDAAVEQLESTGESYRISTEQLRLGAITSFDYLLQKNLYIQALQQYIQAKYNAVIFVKIYEFYKGTPVKM